MVVATSKSKSRKVKKKLSKRETIDFDFEVATTILELNRYNLEILKPAVALSAMGQIEKIAILNNFQV